MTLNVKEIQDFKKLSPEVQDEMLKDLENCELVLNYFSKPKLAHAIYAENYNAKKKWLKCVNSAGKVNPFPRVPIKDVLNLYKVTCTAVMDKRENCGPGIIGSISHDSSVSLHISTHLVVFMIFSFRLSLRLISST